MAGQRHEYRVTVTWRGNLGTGTSGYRAYSRDHVVSAEGKPDIPGSSDPAFRGDPARWNPEDLLVASLSACHKLWYLHFCAVSGVVVLEYEDHAEGVMEMDREGSGRFVDVVLRPRVTIRAGTYPDIARDLHHDAHEKCFIANSVNFPVRCEPVIVEAEGTA
ncbi:OsmC family protein [Pseudomonas sp. R2.Fl]|nr:OsmC family protein [Pseudomonas sp. R2.Fl]